MGFLDKLFGRRDEGDEQQRQQEQWAQQRRQDELRQGASAGRPMGQTQPGQMTDEQAVARYRYMLQTAPPETIEQAHAEAFGKLTPEQRRMVLQELTSTLPENERRAGTYSDDPQSLARMATRAEMRQPGTMERTLASPGISMGGLMAGSFLSSFAGMMMGGMIASAFFGGFGGGGDGYSEGYQDGQENAETGGEDAGGSGDSGDYSDSGSDYGGGDYGGGDFGGGDFGGGDFGGGDF